MKDRLLSLLERLSPGLWIAWHLASDKQALLHEVDVLSSELAVAKCREARWKRAAYTACEGNPQAIRLLDFQATSDALADAPELEEYERNTAPRSAPG